VSLHETAILEREDGVRNRRGLRDREFEGGVRRPAR
jgi:hypothetical protein